MPRTVLKPRYCEATRCRPRKQRGGQRHAPDAVCMPLISASAVWDVLTPATAMPYGVAIHQLFVDTLCYVQYPHDRVRRVRQIRAERQSENGAERGSGEAPRTQPCGCAHSTHAWARAAAGLHTVVTGTWHTSAIRGHHHVPMIRQAGMKFRRVNEDGHARRMMPQMREGVVPAGA